MPPDLHILMRCDEVAGERWTLPADHRIRRYAPGDEAAWARIERAAGAFPGRVQAQVEAYLLDRYDPDALARRCLLAVDGAGRAVGVCTAWREPQGLRDVASLHGLAVEPASQGRGVGRALLDEAMRLFEGLGETRARKEPAGDRAAHGGWVLSAEDRDVRRPREPVRPGGRRAARPAGRADI